MRYLRFLPLVAAFLVACAAEHENLVHVIAEQAPGLKKNARVQFRGVDVGLVKEVYFTGAGVRIDLLIERDDVPIRAQDTVRIASAGNFGRQVVDIQPGVQTAPLIARGATLPRVQPESTVSLPVGVWRSMVRTLGFAADSTTVRLGDSIVHVMPKAPKKR
jgi:ABC-type transporter Mla subunit MlaD